MHCDNHDRIAVDQIVRLSIVDNGSDEVLSFFQLLSSQQYTSHPPITAAASITRQPATAAAKRPAAAPSPVTVKPKGEKTRWLQERRLFSPRPVS